MNYRKNCNLIKFTVCFVPHTFYIFFKLNLRFLWNSLSLSLNTFDCEKTKRVKIKYKHLGNYQKRKMLNYCWNSYKIIIDGMKFVHRHFVLFVLIFLRLLLNQTTLFLLVNSYFCSWSFFFSFKAFLFL